MLSSDTCEAGIRNRLLAALPEDEFARLKPRLKLVELEPRQLLAMPERRIEHVHFIESGWVSVLVLLDEGESAEVGLTGAEGMTNWQVALGEETADFETMVQAPGTAWRLAVTDVHDALQAAPVLRSLMMRFALAQHGQLAWIAVCNGQHTIEQRLARWLLMAHDRSEGDTIFVTHEFLSMMLGVRRAGVTIAAGGLQRAGLIRYGSGRVTIADRGGLEATCCECYTAARRVQERQLPRAGILGCR